MSFAHYTLDERLFLLIWASCLAILIGGPGWLHGLLRYQLPAELWRARISTIAQRLNRSHRPPQVRQRRGQWLLALLSLLTLCIGFLILLAVVYVPRGWIIELVVLTYLLPLRAAVLPVLAVSTAYKHKDYSAIPGLLQPYTPRDLQASDRHGQLRAALAYLAECLPRYGITPSLWYLLAGMPGLMLCRLLSCLADMWPLSHPEYRPFANAAHFWDRMMQRLPVRVSLPVLWAGLLFVPRAYPGRACAAFRRTAETIRLTTRNLPVRVAAYGLDLSLGGPYIAAGTKRPESWHGQGRARLKRVDLSRGLIWYGCSVCLWMIVLLWSYLLLQDAFTSHSLATIKADIMAHF